MLIDHRDQEIVWRKTRNLELCFGTNVGTEQAKNEKISIYLGGRPTGVTRHRPWAAHQKPATAGRRFGQPCGGASPCTVPASPIWPSAPIRRPARRRCGPSCGREGERQTSMWEGGRRGTDGRTPGGTEGISKFISHQFPMVKILVWRKTRNFELCFGTIAEPTWGPSKQKMRKFRFNSVGGPPG